MKKIFASLLVLTMLVCCMSISAFAAQNRATFTVDNAEGEPGESVVINVNITENQGIAAGKVQLTCDQVTITKISNGMWAMVDGDYDTAGTGTSNIAEGIYNWHYTHECAQNGIYAKYTVTIGADVEPGEYPITVVASDLAGVDDKGTADETDDQVISYKDGEVWTESQTIVGTLTVKGEVTPPPPPPHKDLVINTQPADATVTEGETASFAVVADGEGLTYQWQKSVDGKAWVDVEGATGASLDVTAEKADDGAQYRVVVTDDLGNKLTSDAAKLTVNEKTVEPPPVVVEPKETEIKKQPADATVKEGEKAKFEVEAEGEGLTYQWEFSADGGKTWTAIENADKAVLEFDAKLDQDGGMYRVVVTGEGGVVTSDAVTLKVEKKDEGKTEEPKPVEGGDKKDDTKKDDTKKDDTKKDNTAKTGDSTNLYIYMALCLFAAAVIVGVTYELKKSRD